MKTQTISRLLCLSSFCLALGLSSTASAQNADEQLQKEDMLEGDQPESDKKETTFSEDLHEASDKPANDAEEDALFDVNMDKASLTYSASIALALPMGGWGGVGAGAFMHGDYSFKKLKGLHFVGRLGIISHIPTHYWAVTEVPILVGVKYFIIPRFYAGYEIGLAVYFDAKGHEYYYRWDDSRFGAWFADIFRLGYDVKGPWSFGVDFFYARSWDALIAAEYRF